MARGCEVVGVRISLKVVSVRRNGSSQAYLPRADKIKRSKQETSDGRSSDCNTQ